MSPHSITAESSSSLENKGNDHHPKKLFSLYSFTISEEMYTEQYWESANWCWWLKGYGYKLTYHRCFFSVGHLNIAWKSNSVIRSCSANKYLHQIKLFIILEHLDLTVTSRHFCGCFWLKETDCQTVVLLRHGLVMSVTAFCLIFCTEARKICLWPF